VKERRKSELELVVSQHGDMVSDPQLDWFIINSWSLTGWNLDSTPLLVLIPPGYPTTPPDNFYTDPTLRLKNGAPPGNSSEQVHLNRRWLQFSYHVEEWVPHAEFRKGHNLLTFLEGVRKRLIEMN
jgi:hypothetical protein